MQNPLDAPRSHPLRRVVLPVVTAGACSLSLLAIAQAAPTHNPPALHKRHLYRAPYFGHLSGPAEAWVDGRCDLPLRSEFPPCIYPTFSAGSP
jgi:hypothetical protein